MPHRVNPLSQWYKGVSKHSCKRVVVQALTLTSRNGSESRSLKARQLSQPLWFTIVELLECNKESATSISVRLKLSQILSWPRSAFPLRSQVVAGSTIYPSLASISGFGAMVQARVKIITHPKDGLFSRRQTKRNMPSHCQIMQPATRLLTKRTLSTILRTNACATTRSR